MRLNSSIDANDVEGFLMRLKEAGVEPDQVVTDGSSLYPAVLARVWSEAAHQLCLFHATRHVTRAVMKVINTIRKGLPQPPPASATRGGGPIRNQPPSDEPTDPATQRWYWRQIQRRDRIAHVHELAEKGLSVRAIARQTGHHRDTIKSWLQQPIPDLPEDMPSELTENASLPAPLQRKERKQELVRLVHQLAQQKLSYSAIARQVGIHRVTVKKWLQQEPSPVEAEANVEPVIDVPSDPPPEPWSDWDQVRQVREALQEHRFLLLRRPENLDQEEQKQMESLLTGPLGPKLQVARSFLEDWYAFWVDENGQRRSLVDAQTRYEAWRTNSDYRAVPQLLRVQERVTEAKFERLSQFLRDPNWEATNNGAERGGRAFRHRQAPHFNLRKKEHIENAINVASCLRKNAALQPPPHPFHTCQRGRRRRVKSNVSVITDTAIAPVKRVRPSLPRAA